MTALCRRLDGIPRVWNVSAIENDYLYRAIDQRIESRKENGGQREPNLQIFLTSRPVECANCPAPIWCICSLELRLIVREGAWLLTSWVRAPARSPNSGYINHFGRVPRERSSTRNLGSRP